MEWDEYRHACDKPGFMSRWFILQITSLVKPCDAVKLRAIVSRVPLEKPIDHKGDQNTDMFDVNLDKVTTESILESLAHHLHSTSPLDQKQKRLLVNIERTWREFSIRQFSSCDVIADQ